MSDKKPEAKAGGAAGKSKLVIIAVAAVVLLGGGGAGAYFMMNRGAKVEAAEEAHDGDEAHEGSEAPKKKAKKKHAEDEKEGGVLGFDPFVVNLADPGGSRFLRVKVQLVVEEEKVEELHKKEVALVRTRAAILEVLAEQTADKLITPAGKAELKAAIKEHASHVLEPIEVMDVLFSDFVVQF
jgi:flagellar protein FliL